MYQYVDMMCNGEFIDKDPDEAWDYIKILAEKIQTWEGPEKVKRSKPTPSFKGGLFHLREEDDLNIKVANLARKVEAMGLKNASSSKTNSKKLCGICSTNDHFTQECPLFYLFKKFYENNLT